jgi:hypothetical protein
MATPAPLHRSLPPIEPYVRTEDVLITSGGATFVMHDSWRGGAMLALAYSASFASETGQGDAVEPSPDTAIVDAAGRRYLPIHREVWLQVPGELPVTIGSLTFEPLALDAFTYTLEIPSFVTASGETRTGPWVAEIVTVEDPTADTNLRGGGGGPHWVDAVHGDIRVEPYDGPLPGPPTPTVELPTPPPGVQPTVGLIRGPLDDELGGFSSMLRVSRAGEPGQIVVYALDWSSGRSRYRVLAEEG